MEAIEAMKSRRSVRGYRPDVMPSQELIDKVTEAGTYAATGRGMQSPIIIEITNKAVRDRLSHLNALVMNGSESDFDPFYGAPVVLAVLADRQRPTHIYDGSLVMGNLMNAATAVGLGSCWIHRAKEIFDGEEGREMLKSWGIEGDYEGIGFCVLGYPAGDVPAAKPRKENYIVKVK